MGDYQQTNGVKMNGETKTPFLIGVAGGTASGKVIYLESKNITFILYFDDLLNKISAKMVKID